MSKIHSNFSQAPLPINTLLTTYDPADFFTDNCNQEAYELISSQRIKMLPKKTLWLIGDSSSGKSHLANILLNKSKGLTLQPGQDSISKILFDKTITTLVCDGIELFDERELCQIINCAHEMELTLLLTSREKINVFLPDLHTRLSSIYKCFIGDPSDELILTIIYKYLADAQITTDHETINAIKTIASGGRFGFLKKIVSLVIENINREKCRLNTKNVSRILKNII